MTPERFKRITQVLSKRQPDLTVITDEVHKQRNIAAIIRNCDAVGIDRIYCVMPEFGYQIYSGTSASAEKWVTTHHCATVQEPIDELKSQDYQLLAANFKPGAVDYRELDYTKPTALVLGAEVKGLSQTAAEQVDHHVYLPMVGMVESYNVSVACALILAEAQRQREVAGLYAQQRLSQEQFQCKFFRWAHPKLAEYCDENNIEYPPTREDGEVENLSDWFQGVSKKQ